MSAALDPVQAVGLGGAVGAVARHLVGLALPGDRFPFATLAVNALGSLALGLLAFGGAGDGTMLLFGTGACGAFTTFASFSYETVRLWERGERLAAGANAATNLAGALTGVGLAWLLVG